MEFPSTPSSPHSEVAGDQPQAEGRALARNLQPSRHTCPTGARQGCSVTSTGQGGLCISIPPPSCCRPVMLPGHGCVVVVVGGWVAVPLPTQLFWLSARVHSFARHFITRKNGCRRRIMLCPGIGNIRAKHGKKEGKAFTSRTLPFNSSLVCSFFFVFFKLLAPVSPKGRRAGRGWGRVRVEKHKIKSARAASPALLPCSGWLLRGAARASCC